MPDKEKIQRMLGSASEIEDAVERSRKYRNIVGMLCFEALRSTDAWYIGEAVKTAELVTDEPSKAYVEIIRTMAKIGVNRKDEEILRRALEITERMDNEPDLSVSLHEIAIAFAKYSAEKDGELLSYSLKLVEGIPLDTYRSSAYRNISRLLAGMNPEKAMGLLETSIAIIEKSEAEPIYLIPAFCDTASLLSLFDDMRSYDFISKAIRLSSDFKDDFEKSAVLLKIVETGVEVGKRLHDERLLKEAAAISKGITGEYYRTLAQDAIKGM